MWLLPMSVLVVSVIVAIPLGRYLAWIMDGRYHAPQLLKWCEKRVDSGPQNWKQYAVALLVFNTVLYAFGYLILTLQPWMPLNPRGLGALSPSTIFNTVISFSTNTDIQHYSGDVAFSNFTQIFFCLPMFFLSASIGFLRLDCDDTSISQRPTCGQFLPRYVAGGNVHVSAGGVRSEYGLSGSGHADDLSERLSGLDTRAGGDGNRPTTDSRNSKPSWSDHWPRLCR